MAHLSEKELSFVKDMMSEEELLVKKFQMLADQSENADVKEEMMKLSNKHQEHFNKLYAKLS